ncbi:MAG: glycosyltransferase [Actinomycetota bacterium]|nr:glycosyltransferase [Actinomycetota bacterium]
MKKNIAIYDRYLSTAGGGERYSCKIAEALSKKDGYDIDLITDIYADLEEISDKLNLDLRGVNLKVFPFISEDYASRITRKYDLFINATYLSSLPAYGRKNIYLCYFPTPFDVDFKFIHKFLLIFFRRPALWLFKAADRIGRGFSELEIEEGLYEPRKFLLRRGSWSSGRARLKIRVSGNSLKLGLKNPAVSEIDSMKVDVRVSEEKRGEEKLFYSRDIVLKRGDREIIEIPAGTSDKPKIVIISSDTFIPSDIDRNSRDSRKLGVVVYNYSKIAFLRRVILRVLGYIPLFLVTYPANLEFLDTYHKIITISEYSRRWVRKIWKRESDILYPPVDIYSFKVKEKEKIILSVGRFFPEHHNKKQLEMVRVFRQLVDSHPEEMKGYTLYLAGGVSRRTDHLEYVKKITEESRGYPVKVFTNIEWEKLVKIFGSSFIFWHASGTGEDEETHPEKFEHFGITTVEAMAAGCIPVVINKGGQKEIIKNGYNGFLFNSWEELKSRTMDIIKGKIDTEKIRLNASESCRRFSNARFENDLESMVRHIIE